MFWLYIPLLPFVSGLVSIFFNLIGFLFNRSLYLVNSYLPIFLDNVVYYALLIFFWLIENIFLLLQVCYNILMRNLFSVYRLFMRILANRYAEVSRILANKYAEVSRILGKILLKLASTLYSLMYYGPDQILIGDPGARLRDYPNIPLRMLLSRLKPIII